MNKAKLLAGAGAALAAFGMLSVPSFLSAILLIFLFAVELHWLPATGYVPLTEDPLANLRFGRVADLEAISDIFGHRHVPKQSVVLKNKTYFAVACRLLRNIFVVMQHAPGIGDFQTGNDAQ